MDDEIELGSFEVESKLGVGGMGVVYRGRHRATELAVALKVVRPRAADWTSAGLDDEARGRFQSEVQAHAALRHPGVVYLFDYGRVDEAAASAVEEFAVGSPFVAMELADGGALRDALPVTNWRTVYRMLVEVLDALAHSHARDVIHRDLKPENILLFEGDTLSDDRAYSDSDDGSRRAYRAKLADFGIAHALDREREMELEQLETNVGTPLYMAPEQVRGNWRAYGPWTDLYALGCMTWELVCGQPPFTGENRFAVSFQHLDADRPPLDPRFPVPDLLEDWIRRAMAIEPERRFRRAADALRALPSKMPGDSADESAPVDSMSNPDPGEDGRPTSSNASLAETVSRTSTTLAIAESQPSAVPETVPSRTAPSTGHGEETPKSGAVPDGRPLPVGTPSVPEDWRLQKMEPLPAPLVGAGLGLFGLREPPFVDRTRACDAIWRELRSVYETGEPKFVFVSGEAGTGKSKLAEWMTTRAHELGAARIVRVLHSRSGGPSQGLRGALERNFRTLKLNRGAVYEHLVDRLETVDTADVSRHESAERKARALTEYLRPTDENAEDIDGPRFRFSSPEHRHTVAVWALDRLARQRPLMLWVDDLQWGDETLDSMEHLMESPTLTPSIFIVSTLRTDVVSERPDLKERFAQLRQAEWTTTLELEPLGRSYQRELLEGLLPLEDELGTTIVERTEGHPLFAMQLLGHWIERGDLEVGDSGFCLSEGGTLDIPDDIHDLWTERIDRLLETYRASDRPGVRAVLELAAALGREVDLEEWDSVSAEAEIDVEDRNTLVGRLVERGLARRTEEGWSFAHGLLVDSIERQARHEGRWRDRHRQCARFLAESSPTKSAETALRRAHHWEEAGELERVLEPLWNAHRRWKRLGDPERSLDALGHRSRILDDLGAPSDDVRRIENDIDRLDSELVEGAEPDEIAEDVRELCRRAEEANRDDLVARAWLVLSRCRRSQADFEAAAECARNATDAARRSGDDLEYADALHEWGWADYERGRGEAAMEHFSEMDEVARSVNDDYREIWAQRSTASVELARGNSKRAEEIIEEAEESCREHGFRRLEFSCVNTVGEIARFRGEHERAREAYRRCAKMARELHRLGLVALSEMNLGLVELSAGRFDRAADHLDEAEARFTRISRREQRADLFRLARAVRAAGLRNWERFDRLYERYRDGWPSEARLLEDHAWLLEMVGEYAREADENRRARAAWRLARTLREELGHDAGAEELEEKLDDC